MRRHEQDSADNPPLSILFERYNAERKLPPKTKLEWDGVLRRFTEAVGVELPVRVITAAHVRSFKTGLLGTTGRTDKTLSPATVKKNVGALASVPRDAGHERVFPELKATRLGSLTAAWSKWWGRHARVECGITDPRKTFHSFRHLWKDAARAVMPEEHHDAIPAHANGGVGRSYGLGVPLEVLAESMAKVRYPGVPHRLGA